MGPVSLSKVSDVALDELQRLGAGNPTKYPQSRGAVPLRDARMIPIATVAVFRFDCWLGLADHIVPLGFKQCRRQNPRSDMVFEVVTKYIVIRIQTEYIDIMVELTGFEPVTSCLQSRRSPTELQPHSSSLYARASHTWAWRVDADIAVDELRSPDESILVIIHTDKIRTKRCT